MKHMAWKVVLMAMCAATAAPAAEPDKGDEEGPTVEQMERRERELELKAREAELVHENNLRDLELKERRAEIDRMRPEDTRRGKKTCGGFLLVILVINILLTVWVYKDMHEQEISRALWIPIVLLTGIFGAILYAIVRNADTRAKPAGAEAEGKKAA